MPCTARGIGCRPCIRTSVRLRVTGPSTARSCIYILLVPIVVLTIPLPGITRVPAFSFQSCLRICLTQETERININPHSPRL